MDEFFQLLAFTGWIAAVYSFNDTSFFCCFPPQFCRSAAARADSRCCIPVVSTVQVLLYMGNDHVPFGYQDTASRHQLQFPDKGEVMKRGPGYGAPINLHGVKDCHRCQFPETGRRPFNTLENGFIGFVLKFESKSVLVVMSGSSAACGIRQVIEDQYHSVNGKIQCFCLLLQVLDTKLQIFRRNLIRIEGNIRAGTKAQF